MIRVSVAFERDGFSLDVSFASDAHVTGLFGPSGSGKTTLMALLAGLLRPTRGTIAVGDTTLFDSGRGIDLPAHRRRVGVAFQEHRLFPHRSVRGNLLFGAPRSERRSGGALYRQVVDVLELDRLLERRATELSGGERQRVALGRALLCRPQLLLLDEPLSSLDVRLKQQIVPHLQRVRLLCMAPIVYVSHDLTEMLQMTDRIVLMDRGRTVGDGRLADLAHDALAYASIRDRGLRNVCPARVVRHEPGDGVSVLEILSDRDRSFELVIPLVPDSAGTLVTVAIEPSDIALAREPVSAVSIQNQRRGTVSRCTRHESAAIVEVDVGVPLLVEVSRRAVAALDLTAGASVVCLIKSHAIRRVG